MFYPYPMRNRCWRVNQRCPQYYVYVEILFRDIHRSVTVPINDESDPRTHVPSLQPYLFSFDPALLRACPLPT
jgi:hypothetical protein